MVSLAGLTAAFLTILPSLAQAPSGQTVVTHASVVLTRTGEREPAILQDVKSIQLTSLGAQQAYAAGVGLRQRYMAGSDSELSGAAPIYGLSTDVIDINQMYVLSGNAPYMIQTAQAFLQALYPAFNISDNDDTSYYERFFTVGDPSQVMQNPLSGYQYPWFQTAQPSEGTSIIIDGSEDCDNWYTFNQDFPTSSAYEAADQGSRDLYSTVANALADYALPMSAYSFASAYGVYDYLSYKQIHNASVNQILSSPDLLNIDAMPRLQHLADQFNFQLYSNAAEDANAYNDPIATVAGQTFAGGVMQVLQSNIDSGGETTKLSLFFTEFEPFMSFFALSGLTSQATDFWGLPLYSSSMVFELFSYADADNATAQAVYPSEDDLRVRFMFRNGTGDSYVVRGLFDIGTSDDITMPWNDFKDRMSQIMITDFTTWCNVCNSWLSSEWCLYYNSSVINDVLSGGAGGGSSGPYIVTPKIAGVIGAVATLAVIGLILILAVAFAGLRFKRAAPKPKHSLGGFKGNQKLASDIDVTHDRKSMAGASIVEESNTKERVGSWELKDGQGVQRPVSLRRPSFEDDDRMNPFNDPVHPRESV